MLLLDGHHGTRQGVQAGGRRLFQLPLPKLSQQCSKSLGEGATLSICPRFQGRVGFVTDPGKHHVFGAGLGLLAHGFPPRMWRWLVCGLPFALGASQDCQVMRCNA